MERYLGSSGTLRELLLSEEGRFSVLFVLVGYCSVYYRLFSGERMVGNVWFGVLVRGISIEGLTLLGRSSKRREPGVSSVLVD
jgi:hypothetical protein